MDYLLYITFIFVLIIKYVIASVKGQDTSILFLSNTTIFNYNDITELVVFGDSFSSVDTNYKDMSYTGENRSGGKNWPLQLKDMHNVTLWDFAARGAVVDFKIVPRDNFKIDMLYEYQKFLDIMTEGKQYGDRWNSTSSLFAIWIGTNDILNVNRWKRVNREFDKVNKVLFNLVEGMYYEGARNFLFLNIPPMERSPYNKRGNRNYLKNYITYFNKVIYNYSENLFKNHPDINLFIYDTNGQYNYILDRCNQYKYTDCKNAWNKMKGNPNIKKFFWSDFTHMSYRGNAYMAKDIEELLYSISRNQN
ncbi:hypothetical protein LY90DRAFT_670219 [Neocallimastix californiae]|jgi:phospholipase/lecithinase/hemolysin|uniref:Carbohydrate esterase family 16 protein n=1 Tax=Neocallimastix californiae TaxID=1754190 RepID=A0A1Y2D4W6_9FUNG|nr:hypothetical protein LY90DRAFT_670219 [Neocallimastix californiae]|eukprot:ORY54136.1 hypothetical protein LY90DRAFT_670219 [Neocallimastix californiae]